MPKFERVEDKVISLKEKREDKIKKQAQVKLINLLERIPELHKVLGCKGGTKVKYKAFWTGDIKEDLDKLSGDDIMIIYGPNYSPIFTEEEERVCLHTKE